ncbi:putative quinol monooxygenase [Bacillus sp. 03113]|uniref:putative quinol monooxygenase n=1 Tax=Bacillus sp. 03113 TaxID=2578211 RepID=UPI0011420BCD|nr:putative quinol monooxygenase [Bacillus sp. 03113]
MVIIHAVFKVNPERRVDFLAETKTLIAGSQSELGNITYQLYEEVNSKNTFIMVEEWKDQQAVETHNQEPHFTNFIAKLEEFLVAPVDVKNFSVEKL